MSPAPRGKVKRRVQKAFPELGKIRANSINSRLSQHDARDNHAANENFTNWPRDGAAGDRARSQGSAPRSCDSKIDRGIEDFRRVGDFTDYRRRTARIRRKSRAGSQG